ncbi:MAG: YtxH domain-containing protein [Pseudomonas sp.]|nr:MAG: YtxH domain-containing protein [Pseudomonas sp.]
MDNKPNSGNDNVSNPPKTSSSSEGSPSADLRRDVDRATGKIGDAAKDTKNQVVDDAKDAKDQAADAVQEVKGEVVDAAKDVKDQVSDAADDAQQTVSRMADKVQETGEKAIEATRGYATFAVNATGQKVRDLQGQFEVAKSTANDYIQEDPVRAVTYAAIGSAVLTAALIGIFRRR